MCEYKMAPFLCSDTIPPWPTLYSQLSLSLAQPAWLYPASLSDLQALKTWLETEGLLTETFEEVRDVVLDRFRFQLPLFTHSHVFCLIHFSRPSHNATVSHSDSTLRTASPHKRILATMADSFKAGKVAAAENLPSASGLPAEVHGVEWGVEMGILPHLPSNSPSLLEQLRSQGGQPGGVPLGSPSEKDCGFSCKDRYELTLRSQCHWDSARLLSWRHISPGSLSKAWPSERTRAWLSLPKQVSSTGQSSQGLPGSWPGPGQTCRFSAQNCCCLFLSWVLVQWLSWPDSGSHPFFLRRFTL